VKDKTGRIQYHYGATGFGARSVASGPIIPWISDEQAQHFLRVSIIERIDD
jgi:hypothetical protein